MLKFKIKPFFLIFYLSILSRLETSPSPTLAEKPMVIAIASYNNRKWVYNNLMSVFMQDYSNYRIIYIDDASVDGTADEVAYLVKEKSQESRFTLIRNNIRKGGLSNLYDMVSTCSDEEIIVNLDGDDWLANNSVLTILNKAYSSQNIWLTHGTLIEYPSNATGWSIPIPEEIIECNAFRRFRCPSHLKTFYAWLFKKINIQDLKYQDDFFPMTWDQAIMFPMMEMAGKRHTFIPEILYIYNTSNPINDNKVNAQLQNNLERIIRSKPTYTKLPEAAR